MGAIIIRIGFWGPLYSNYNKEPQIIQTPPPTRHASERSPHLAMRLRRLLMCFEAVKPKHDTLSLACRVSDFRYLVCVRGDTPIFRHHGKSFQGRKIPQTWTQWLGPQTATVECRKPDTNPPKECPATYRVVFRVRVAGLFPILLWRLHRRGAVMLFNKKAWKQESGFGYLKACNVGT